MAFGLHTTQKWQNRNAVLITASTSGLDSEIAERFERRKWSISRITTSVDIALNELKTGRATFLIVDDHPTLPASYVLRQLLNHKISYFTPTIVLSFFKDGKEKACFSSMLTLHVIEKPVVPARFIELFEFMLFKWSNAELADLFAAGQLYLKGQNQATIKSLARLITQREIANQATCCLALFLRENGDFKTAEKILLSALKQSSKNIGVILSLVDLYIRAAMPYMAQRLLQSANIAFDHPLTLAIDTLQTHLMLNDINVCIRTLEKMVESAFMPDVGRQLLSRLYYAEGMDEELQKIMALQFNTMARLQAAWSKQEPAATASADKAG